MDAALPLTALAILLAAAWAVDLLVAGSAVDRWLWQRRSRHNLVAVLNSNNARLYEPALLELKRRGDDISPYAPRVVAMLVSASRKERAAAELILRACFLDLLGAIAGYSATADIEACRAKAQPLLSRFSIER